MPTPANILVEGPGGEREWTFLHQIICPKRDIQSASMSSLDKDLEVLRLYFDTTSRLDVDGALATFHDDIIVEAPFTPDVLPLVPKKMDKAEVTALYQSLPSFVAPLKFTNVTIEPLQRPGEYLCTYQGNSKMLATGLPYENRYISRISMRDGKIVHFAEHYDGITLLTALGGTVTAPKA